MNIIESIVRSDLRPKAKQKKLAETVCANKGTAKTLVEYFRSASDVDKGTCADAMKHISEQRPEILEPYIDVLIGYIAYGAPRVKWGIQETIGNMAKRYPNETARAIPYLLQNTVENKTNTTVIRWCAAFGLSEIAKHCPAAREGLLPRIRGIAEDEKNNGVRNVYLKALRLIESAG